MYPPLLLHPHIQHPSHHSAGKMMHIVFQWNTFFPCSYSRRWWCLQAHILIPNVDTSVTESLNDLFKLLLYQSWACWQFYSFSHITNAHSSGSALTSNSSHTVSVWSTLEELGSWTAGLICLCWFVPSDKVNNEDGSSSSNNHHTLSSSSTSQAVSSSPSAPQTGGSSATNGLHSTGTPGLSTNGTNTTQSAGSRTAPLLTTTSGKNKNCNSAVIVDIFFQPSILKLRSSTLHFLLSYIVCFFKCQGTYHIKSYLNQCSYRQSSSWNISFFPPGKTPPNLAQGVPPLLANQYIMGPGGLLPAYPVSILISSPDLILVKGSGRIVVEVVDTDASVSQSNLKVFISLFLSIKSSSG